VRFRSPCWDVRKLGHIDPSARINVVRMSWDFVSRCALGPRQNLFRVCYGRELYSQAKETEPELRIPARPLLCLVQLEPDVSPELQDARVVCAGNLSKRGADVLGIIVKVIEFSVVEDVERIDAELERDSFIELRRLC